MALAIPAIHRRGRHVPVDSIARPISLSASIIVVEVAQAARPEVRRLVLAARPLAGVTTTEATLGRGAFVAVRVPAVVVSAVHACPRGLTIVAATAQASTETHVEAARLAASVDRAKGSLHVETWNLALGKAAKVVGAVAGILDAAEHAASVSLTPVARVAIGVGVPTVACLVNDRTPSISHVAMTMTMPMSLTESVGPEA
jgi:hypothetical protein